MNVDGLSSIQGKRPITCGATQEDVRGKLGQGRLTTYQKVGHAVVNCEILVELSTSTAHKSRQHMLVVLVCQLYALVIDYLEQRALPGMFGPSTVHHAISISTKDAVKYQLTAPKNADAVNRESNAERRK